DDVVADIPFALHSYAISKDRELRRQGSAVVVVIYRRGSNHFHYAVLPPRAGKTPMEIPFHSPSARRVGVVTDREDDGRHPGHTIRFHHAIYYCACCLVSVRATDGDVASADHH